MKDIAGTLHWPEINLYALKLKFSPDELKISSVYCYEGDTDPADEATVYGFTSITGIKGIFAIGYGISSENNDAFDILSSKKMDDD